MNNAITKFICLVGVLVLCACGRGCTGTTTARLSVDDVPADAEPITTFNGEWLSPQLSFAFEITDHIGVVTLPSSDVTQIGDIVLVITSVDGDKFSGRELFSNGTVYDVIGVLVDPYTLSINGGGLSWTMGRISTLNLPPEVDAGDAQTVTLDTGEAVLSATAEDDGVPDGELTTQWSVISGPEGVEFEDVGSLVSTASFPEAGMYELQLEAFDGELTSVDTVVITVNTPPTADAGEDQAVSPGEMVTLDGTASDDVDPGDALSHIWLQTGGATVQLEEPIEARPSFAAPEETGTLTFQLTVADSFGGVATDTVTVSVTAESNDPPRADTGADRTVVPGLVVTLDGSRSSDPQGDPLTYAWAQTDGAEVTLDQPTNSLAAFTVPEGAESLQFQLTVDDGRGGVDTASVTLTVVSQPRVRLATSLGDVSMEVLLAEAPITSLNFLQYVEDGFYEGSIFHRIVPGFVVQGGGYDAAGVALEGSRGTIINEFDLSRSNIQATVAMAKVGSDPDSASSEFFFNLVDNSENLDNQNGGFTVFARVLEGMEVVEAMAAVELVGEEPVEDILLTTATIE